MAADVLIERKQLLVYTDIFYHRSMEKDKLYALNVCGVYGQKDIERLDRSGPARSGVGVGTKIS